MPLCTDLRVEDWLGKFLLFSEQQGRWQLGYICKVCKLALGVEWGGGSKLEGFSFSVIVSLYLLEIEI